MRKVSKGKQTTATIVECVSERVIGQNLAKLFHVCTLDSHKKLSLKQKDQTHQRNQAEFDEKKN